MGPEVVQFGKRLRAVLETCFNTSSLVRQNDPRSASKIIYSEKCKRFQHDSSVGITLEAHNVCFDIVITHKYESPVCDEQELIGSL